MLYLYCRKMKRIIGSILFLSLFGTFDVSAMGPVNLKDWDAVSIGAKKHVESSVSRESIFAEDDISYRLGYEYHESDGAWQIVLDYCPSVEGSDQIEYLLTPELNVMFKDKEWRTSGGVGILKTLVKTQTESEWTDLYWQLLLSINLPLSREITLDLNAFYFFDSWNNLNDFDSDDLEYGASLVYKF